jgi:pimeloyl-ACP methyl ester carboxylesterase
MIPGNLRRARNYDALAAALRPDYTVHILEPRGRGEHVPGHPGRVIEQEVDDALALLDRTGAGHVFGHSFGGLVALQLALRRDLERLVVYEPAVSINGSISFDFLPEIERLLDRGRPGAALARYLYGMGFIPPIPRFLQSSAARLMMATREGREIRQLLPTIPIAARAVRSFDSDGTRYAAIGSPTLVLAGGRSPGYLRSATQKLAEIIPNAKSEITPEFDHNAPDMGAPEKVAQLIRA